MNILVISGSPRKTSVTHRLALFLHRQFTAQGKHNVELLDVRDWNLPLLQQVFSSVEKTPEEFRPLAEKIFGADAFVLVTPEYNGSYSPALQNLLDHFGKRIHKPFGIATASVGAMGGLRSSQQLLLLVPALFGIASPFMLVTPMVDKKFDAEGNLLDQSFQATVDTFMHEFIWLAESVHPKHEPAYN